jgi:uncharacterized LabA/DUF88 family protein
MISEESGQDQKRRAALYVDGFNLYHPILRMGAENNHLKWACLWRLGENLAAAKGQRLVKVVFCTAVPSVRQNPSQRDRHIKFNDSQRASGVTIIEGHYVPENIEVAGIPTGDTKWTEKQTDINVGLELIMDGLDDVYDVAMLLSADTDQVATARVFTERLSPLGKSLLGVAPPDRSAPSGYSQYKVPSVVLKKFDIERCIMPEEITYEGRMIRRPTEYAPPDGWIHPDNLPKEKAPKAPTKWGPAAKG